MESISMMLGKAINLVSNLSWEGQCLIVIIILSAIIASKGGTRA